MSWIRKCEEWKVPIVSGPTIRAKAIALCDEMLSSPSHDDPTRLAALTFSHGWLYRFQQRHDLKSRRVYGEAASASEQVVNEGRLRLRDVTRGYEKRNIYNLDETAYFYCSSQTKTICTLSMPGRKKVKKRITVAVTSNADGSCRWPLLFIGTAKQPRSDVAWIRPMKSQLRKIWIDSIRRQVKNSKSQNSTFKLQAPKRPTLCTRRERLTSMDFAMNDNQQHVTLDSLINNQLSESTKICYNSKLNQVVEWVKGQSRYELLKDNSSLDFNHL
ncbi:hypothetical protein DYB26_006426 [Aphanomyces astaci]|uniref:HTH CENPB-type domain-containing protein n=1 Tax=Aphanomyces astaci TaxID=112090 RepID=A0A397EF58_APHAT|nr:hypothetical protein DYB31_010358 [Aphanomyces astaci]RHZ17051.1 hypothetical protein DYB26_006426 [Aphanomyces astaci]